MEEENSIKENLVGSKIKDWFISNSPSIIIALFSILSVSLLHYSGILNTYELKLLDMKYQQRGPLSGSDAISSWPNDENYIDIGNGVWDEGEDFIDIGNGVWDEGEEFDDMNGNGVWDQGEELWDDFGNGVWDEGEEFTDLGNGAYDLNDQLNQDGVGCWKEEVCGNGVWDDWESLTDLNGNDVWDEGEAWVETDQCQEQGDVCFQGACIDYKECHDINRNGVRDLGLDVVYKDTTMTDQDGEHFLYFYAGNLPDRCIAHVNRHWVAVRDGAIWDTWDSRGSRPKKLRGFVAIYQ